MEPERASRISEVCCILHNILQLAGESVDEEFVDFMVSAAEAPLINNLDVDAEKKEKAINNLYFKNIRYTLKWNLETTFCDTE